MSHAYDSGWLDRPNLAPSRSATRVVAPDNEPDHAEWWCLDHRDYQDVGRQTSNFSKIVLSLSPRPQVRSMITYVPLLSARKCCRRCHFLVKHRRSGASVQSDDSSFDWYTDSWNAQERADGHPPRDREWTDACWRGIWDHRSHIKLKIDLDEDRADTCFFFEWQEGLHLRVADEMQRQQYDNRHLKKGYRHTQIGLWIAAVGIAISTFFQVLNFFQN